MVKRKENIYVVKKGEMLNLQWMREHPEYTAVKGIIWDPETEQEYCTYIDNYFWSGYSWNKNKEK